MNDKREKIKACRKPSKRSKYIFNIKLKKTKNGSDKEKKGERLLKRISKRKLRTSLPTTPKMTFKNRRTARKKKGNIWVIKAIGFRNFKKILSLFFLIEKNQEPKKVTNANENVISKKENGEGRKNNSNQLPIDI